MTTELENKTSDMMDQFGSIAVVDAEGYQRAATFLVRIKEVKTQIAEAYDSIIASAFKAHKEAVKKKKEAEAPFVYMEENLNPKIKEYLRLEEAKRQAAQEELNRKLREEEETERLRQAAELEAGGKRDEAEKVLAKEHAAIARVQSSVPNVAGFRKPRGNWKFQVVDETLVPDQYWQINMLSIGAVIRSTKGKLAIPGIMAFEE